MTAIGKGDFVEALNDSPEDGIVQGCVYTVTEIIPEDAVGVCTDCGEAGDGFLLKETPEANRLGAFCPCGFKPISGGPPRMFDHMLKAPTDAPTKEPVAA